MKKLITILTIMIVLVGSVFAETGEPQGTAEVLVTATITEKLPTFRLQAVSGTNVTAGAASSETGAAQPTQGAATIEANALDDTSKHVTVNFKIQQVAAALTYKTFYFNVTATNLVLIPADGTPYDTQQKVDALAAGKKTLDINAGSVNPTITPETIANTTKGEAGAETSITYLGIRVEPVAPAESIDVASFSCQWDGNPEAVPGTYQGTVTLTVSAQ